MNSQDPLELDSLPSDPRIAALGLLGLATSELKEIDSRIVSGNRNYIGGMKSNVENIYREITTISSNGQPAPAPPQQQQQPVQTFQTAQLLGGGDIQTQSIPQYIPQPVQQVQPQQEVNKDQLEFDFYKKIKPEDLEYQLKSINSSIKRLEDKINAIYDVVVKKNS